MAQGFVNTFNAWFGSNKTYIANDSGKEIKVTLSDTKLRFQGITVSASSPELKVDAKENVAWVVIGHGSYQKFERTAPEAFLTVQWKTSESKEYESIAENFPIPANHSFIVEENGRITRQKYGSSDLFERQYD